MSDRTRGLPMDADDQEEAPFVDETERTEFEWLLARERDPDVAPPSATVARDYAALEELLATLPSQAADDGWQEEVVRAASSAASSKRWSTRRLVLWTSGAAVAIAAAVILALWPFGRATPP